jgi:MFS transporter, DHA1 family, multidrug resistance protein
MEEPPVESQRPAAAFSSQAPPRRGVVVIVILAALTGISPLATDMYLPSFPSMARSLHASSSIIQLTLAAYMLGMVIGQLLIGPVSDTIGRRRLLQLGVLLFAVFSLLCSIAPNAELLNVFRLFQGITGSAGMVLARAAVADWYQGPEAAKRFSALSMIFAVAPIFAPVIGGLVLDVSSWRAIFLVLAAIGLVLLALVTALVPESLPADRRQDGGVGSAFKAMGGLLKERAFFGYVLTFAFVMVALFGYISGSSFVFQDIYGLSATKYSLVFATSAVGTLVGGAIFGATAGKVRMNSVLTAGVVIGLINTIGQFTVSTTIGSSLTTSWIFAVVGMFAVGLVIPSVMAIGQEVGRRALGAASALLGAGQCLFAAIAAPLTGALGTSTDTPMSAVMLVGFGTATLVLVTLAQPWKGHGEHTHAATDPAEAAVTARV